MNATRGLQLALVVGAALGLFLHFGFGWGQLYRGVAPLLLLGLVAAVVWIGEATYRLEWSWRVTLGPVPALAALWVVGLWAGPPAIAEPMRGFWRLARRGGLGTGEDASLIAGIDAHLLLFGLLLVVALPVMLWVLAEFWESHRPNWLLVSAYAWSFLVLAALGSGWNGLAALFVVMFGAVGVLALGAWLEVARPVSVFTRPPPGGMLDWDRDELQGVARSAVLVALIVLLVMGMGIAQLPVTMDSATHDETTHETATAIEAFADEHGYAEAERFVFNEWETTRMVNYVASGDSRSDSYARANYRDFVTSSDADAWEARLDGRVGFLIVEETRFAYPRDSMQVRLFNRHGSAGEHVEGLSRYRLLFVSQDGSTKAFAFVPGATINGTAEPDATIRVETEVTVSGEQFTYYRTVETDSDGHFEVAVAYPGQYAYEGGSVTVSAEAVMDGETVRDE